MSELAGLLAEDSRAPIARLRRHQLWKVAKAYDIPFPDNATAVMMVTILEGAGVDVTRPLPDGEQVLRMVPVQREDGSTTMEAAPVEKPHATLNKNIDYDAEIEKRIAENGQLQEANDGIAAQLAEIMGKLNGLADENAALKAENEALKQPAPKRSHKKKAVTTRPGATPSGEDLT